ncbi:hypothetical protein [Bradyrhizobium elkanii]|uniref:hypothetical protein n=1 Tax=Bradyrhizobium elkanii TaxID=29448 RepID=UPI000841CF26|nr:hypothetical protein [Bradyrhizobium elkanii]ODM77798.1 hypothetical protein A6452_34550 [Bradyrhizobium elkanii]ODM81746.1 hypothetical protein A6X20_18965 [Bradyrhizobium elkanii]
MPSLDTIRTVTIRGQADNVDQTRAALDRLTASIQAANQNLAQTKQVANDNRDGWSITGEGAASAANHLRQAAEAAYAFSPAFRGVVNGMAVPALQGAGTALEAVAAGIVTATNVAGTGVVRIGTAIETTFPAFALLAGNVKQAGAAMEAFSPTLGGTAATIASRLLPALSLLGKAFLIYDVIKLTTQAWELGNAKLAEYVELSQKAATAGLSTEFYQRIAKAAEEAKTPVEALTEAFKKLNEAAAPRLGGSSAQNRLDELVKAGNFSGNSGVAQLQGANSNEERLRAIASLTDQALEKGQRLAAIDITRSFLGDQAAANLAKDSGYLDDLLEKADKIRAHDLISAGTIANAVELQDRLDAAEKILSQRWHPIQDVLTQLGIKMKETWVDIVEEIAKAVDAVFQLGTRIASALSPLVDFMHTAGDLLQKAAPYIGALPVVGAPASTAINSAGKLLGTADTSAADSAQREALLADARKRLAEGLNRRNDTSIAPKAAEDTASAYSRAVEAVQKYMEVTQAATATVGMSVAEQEKARVVAQLTAAGMKDGLSREAARAKAEMSGLGDAAGVAAQALERAKVAADIKFNRDTALLSQDDVQIAQHLKGLYPDVATALASVEAQAIRSNNAFKEMGQAIEQNLTTGLADIASGTKTVGQGFSDMATAVVRAIEQMIIKITVVEPLMRALQSAAGGLGGLSFGSTGGAASSTGGAGVGGLGGLYHTGGIIGSEPTSLRYVHAANFNGAPRFHTGGIAGDEVPIIAKKGEGVFTPGQMAALGAGAGGGKASNVTINNYTDATPSVQKAPNGDVTVTLRKAVDGAVGDSLSTGAGRRVLSGQYGLKPFTGQ